MAAQTPDEPRKDKADSLHDSPFLTTKEAAALLKLAPATLVNMRALRTGPKYRRHGRLIRYHIDELNAWSVSRQTDPAARDEKPGSDG